MRDIVLSHVPHDRAMRVLDVGCGTGSLLFRLANALPFAELVGIDVSPANIHAPPSADDRSSSAIRLRRRTIWIIVAPVRRHRRTVCCT
jgi:trans-aconitate methyltransferase